MNAPIPFPPELGPYRAVFDLYLGAKLRHFGDILIRKLGPKVSNDQIKHIIEDSLRTMAQQDASAAPQRPLRLVIRHDCQSTGCGDTGCMLCQYNPSRLCTRNVKQKYLIDDHLKAKCGAPLRVELVDDTGACHTEGLAPGVQLEMHVLNGEKYKELCPDNTLLSIVAIRNCIISHHTKALLKREGMSEDTLRVYLQLERGTATVSDLTLTTSSEALLSGKAPTFRLLAWAVEANGEPVPHITYVVSESFVVATKRVKHAIKSDIPSVGDNVSKLLHIGKATVDKLTDLRAAFQEEGFEVKLPESLLRVEKVGQFRQLVEMSEGNNDLKNKLRHVLKLSPEKWDEVCQHALSAVVPDFRSRVWWCAQFRLGLLYACKNGAIMMENPIGIVRLGPSSDVGPIISLQSLSPADLTTIPRLKQTAMQHWYMSNHPNWAVYVDNAEESLALAATGGAGAAAAGHSGASSSPSLLPLGPGSVGMGVPQQLPAPSPSQTPPPASVYLPQPPSASMPLGGMPGQSAGGYGGRDLFGLTADVAYGQPKPAVYGPAGAGALSLQMPMAIMGGGGRVLHPTGVHRISTSSPFAMQQPQQSPELLQAQPPQGTPQHNMHIPKPGLAPAAAGTQDGARSGPSDQRLASGTSSATLGTAVGLMGSSVVALAPAGLTAAGGGAPTSAGRSPFAQEIPIMADIAGAFPKFAVAGPSHQQHAGAGRGPTGSHAGRGQHDGDHCHDPGNPGGAGDPHSQGSLFAGLDPLKTELLFGNGMSGFDVPPLNGNDTTDWMQHLHGESSQLHGLGGVNSYTMVDVGAATNGGAPGSQLLQADGVDTGVIGGGHGGGEGASEGMDTERRLSTKFNSINLTTLDFDGV